MPRSLTDINKLRLYFIFYDIKISLIVQNTWFYFMMFYFRAWIEALCGKESGFGLPRIIITIYQCPILLLPVGTYYTRREGGDRRGKREQAMVPVFGFFFLCIWCWVLCCLLWRGLSGFYNQDFLMQNMLVGRFLNVAWCHLLSYYKAGYGKRGL